MASYSAMIFSLEITLGVGLVIVGFFFFYRRLKKKKKIDTDKQSNEKMVSAPKSVKPVFLFFFGASNTVGDLPTAFPYLLFVAKLVEAKQTLGAVLLLMVIYCLVYILPLIIVYFLYLLSRKKLERLIEKVQTKVAALSEWAAIIVPAAAGAFFGIHGCISLFT